jgi:hypothetical protein
MSKYLQLVKQDWQRRPWWMNLIFYFCVYMTFIYMPFDLFWKPVAADEEIWFGFTLHGWWAKATEPLHWAIYSAGAYGFWKMKAWMWPWAAVYAAQVAIAMLVFNLVNPKGGGWPAGIVAGLIFAIPMIALWRARLLFTAQQTPQNPETPA